MKYQGYEFTLKSKIWGIFFGSLIIAIGGIFLSISHRWSQYAWIYTLLCSIVFSILFIIGVSFKIYGRFIVIENGIRFMLWKWQINKFYWKELTKISVRTRYENIFEVILHTEKGVKRYGKDIQGWATFLPEIIDSARAYNKDIEVVDLGY